MIDINFVFKLESHAKFQDYRTLVKKIFRGFYQVSMVAILMLQPRKCQFSNSQVSDITKSVVKDKKVTVHYSHPGAI